MNNSIFKARTKGIGVITKQDHRVVYLGGFVCVRSGSGLPQDGPYGGHEQFIFRHSDRLKR